MDVEIKKLLQDILTCLINIENYLGTDASYAAYDINLLLQDAVERNLITIGEAMKELLKIYPGIAITNARKIVDVRNRLTHGYDTIENMQVWNIIINHLPLLKEEASGILND